jgi:anaerobic ribonucleoside-triphosphate reductase activating protein
MLRIGAALPVTEVAGPGRRFALWVQGCERHCNGCSNAKFWDPLGGQEISVERLSSEILATPTIEGVTFIGGEPFLQAGGLSKLASLIKPSGLSVITYTGFTFQELVNAGNNDFSVLLNLTDLLVDGPYIEELKGHPVPWIGSKNQMLYFLTNRYSINDIKTIPSVELHMLPGGEIIMNGLV